MSPSGIGDTLGAMRARICRRAPRRWSLGRRLFELGVVAIVLAFVPAVLSSAAVAGGGTGISKVLVIMEENHSSSDVFPSASNPTATMPYLWSLAQQYGYATNWSDVTFASQPNYLSIFAGTTEGDQVDCAPGPGCQWPGPTVFSEAIAEGGTAKTYAEGMQTNCSPTTSGYYDYNHNPWVYFTDPTDVAECAANDVPAGTPSGGALLTDIQSGALPTVGLLKPTLQNDTTLGDFATADSWLQSWIPKIQSGSDWQSGHLAIVVAFDEGNHQGASGENVPFVMIAPGMSGVQVSTALNHYALTRFLDEVAGASLLGSAGTQPDIAPLFGVTLNPPTTQVISFSGPGTGAAGGSATLTATGGGSGNPIVFSVDPSSGSGVCAVSGANGSTVTYLAAGTCVIDANQAAGNGFSAAAQVVQSVSVADVGAQTISFTAPASGVVGGTATLTATGGASGNPVVFSVDLSSAAGVCSVSGLNGATVTYTGVGLCVIDANQAAGNGYAAAPQVTQTVTVNASSHTVWVVDNTVSACNDAGPGNSAQPFCTIGAGAAVAQPGDVVLVRAGTYAGTSINPVNAGVTFLANPGVTITGGTSAFALSNSNNITVSGFTITHTSSTGIIVSGGSNVTISSNTESFAGTPISAPGAGISLNNVNGGVIENNVTHDNSAHGIYLLGSTTSVLVEANTSYHNAYQNVRNANGIDDIAPGNEIIGNITYANEDSGINLYPGANNTLVANNVSYGNGDHGIDDLNVTGGRIIGNTIYYNCTSGINVEGTSSNYVVENNIAVDNATNAVINPTPIPIDPSTGAPYYTNTCNRRHGNIGIWDSAPASTAADYNLVYQDNGTSAEYIWNGTTYSSQQTLNAATGQEAHGIFADPQFANPAAGNFQLTPASPAIDSADSLVTGEQPTDIFGRPRVDDTVVANTGNPAESFVDRGAYEYQGPFTLIDASDVTTTTPAGTAVPITLQGTDSNVCDLTFTIVSGPTNGTLGSISNQQCKGGSPNTDTATVTYAPQAGFTGADSVTYRVSDGSSQSAPATASITVANAKPPVASLTVTPSTGSAPLVVTANASNSTAGTNPIASYTFAWGDGSTTGPQAGSSATHTYTTAGTRTVTLTVTDSVGLTSTASATVTTTVTSTNLVGNPGFETGLSGWNTSGSGTGVTLTQAVGGHTGTYSALLTNTSSVNAGCTLNDSPNWVASTSPGTYTASIWVRADAGGKPLNLRLREYSGSTLVGTGTSTITLSTSWQQVTVAYTVAAAGTTLDLNAYTTTANSPPGTCFYADDASIIFGTASSAPIATLAVSPTSGPAPVAVAADASGSAQGANPIASYKFAWGDGTSTGPQSGATAGHTYTASGTYTVTLTVTDSLGLTSTATATVTVSAAPPTAALTLNAYSGAAPVDIGADASASMAGSSAIASYSFNWGDGTSTGPQSAATANHTYTNGGTYTVKVTVTDTDGSSAQATQQVVVAILPPSAALSVSPSSGTAPLPVSADASGSTAGSTPIASYSFDWGDGSTTGPQSAATANHTYSSGGTYTVTVTVTDTDGTTATTTQQVSVSTATPPNTALLVLPVFGMAPLPISADASGSTAGSAPIASYSFDWGDGTSTGPQTAATANHTYSSGGTYTVTVTVTDTDGGAATASQQVTVAAQPPTAALSVSPSSGQAGVPVSADASGSTPGSAPITSYSFAWGDGNSTGPQSAATANHTYTTAGTYTVIGTVTDTDGTTATATQQVSVAAPTPPTAALTVTPTSGTAPVQVSADASGSTAGSSTIASYSFAWGDGNSTGPQSAATANHTYASAGTYTVTVTVTDTDGTTATATQQVSVAAPTPPTTVLTVTPASGTAPLPVSADASGSTAGSSPISTYSFAWGDGTSTGPQSAATATHTYTKASNYTVTVTVTDTDGTTATATQQVSVAAPTPPTAALTVTPTSGQAPLPVSADASGSTAGSSAITSYSFAWGDGNSTGPQSTATANHTYSTAGNYTVTVTVTDSSGLTASATATVAVGGNYVGNPGFESGLTGWDTTGSGTGVTLAQASGGHSGSFSAQLSNTSGSKKTCLLNDNPNWIAKTTAGAYTAGLWVKGATSGATLNLRLREYNGSTLVGSRTATVSLATSWKQVTVTYMVQSPGSTLDFNAFVNSAPTGTCFYADDASITFAAPPTAALSVSPSSGQAPLPVSADASGSTAGTNPISTYTFAWGDGSANTGPQAGSTAGHTYAAAGNYTVTVTVTDSSGLTATATATVAVGGNYVANPGFESGLTGWNTSGSGSGVTLTQVTGGHSGNYSALLSNTSSSKKTCLLNDNPNWIAKTTAGTYTGSLWVEAATAGATLNLRLREYNGSTLVGSNTATITLSTAWQQITVAYTIRSPGSTLDFNAYVNNAATGGCFYADDASITLG
jgi:parallel beta-helix repeat protein